MVETTDTQPLPVTHRDHPHLSNTPDTRSSARRPARKRRSLRSWVATGLVTCGLLFAAGIVGLVLLIYVQARADEARQVDAIVVMGAAQFNGTPSPVLQARLDQALALYNAELAPRIVVTGGSQPGDAFTEAEASLQYLVERGVPAQAIIVENEGRSTWESAQGVAQVAPPDTWPRVLVVSDGFHLFRSEMMLRELGYEAWSSPAPGSPIEPWSVTELSYVVREAGAVIAFLPELLS